MPGGRVYVINSPDLVLAVQRQPKKVSFWFIEATFAVGMGGLSKEAAKALQDNIHGEDDKSSLVMDAMRVIHQDLMPSQGLDQMSLGAAQKFAASVDVLTKNGTVEIELWKWINHELVASITDGVYGPKNPYRNPDIIDAFL